MPDVRLLCSRVLIGGSAVQAEATIRRRSVPGQGRNYQAGKLIRRTGVCSQIA
jgi:hypothetical protein